MIANGDEAFPTLHLLLFLQCMEKMHAKSKYTNVSNGLPTVYLKRELLSTQNARGLVTCWFRFVCTRLIPTDNRLMDAGSTGSYFTARYESTNTDKSEARGLNTRNEEQVRIIMQCTDIFCQKWRFPLFLDSIHAIIIRKNLLLTVSC